MNKKKIQPFSIVYFLLFSAFCWYISSLFLQCASDPQTINPPIKEQYLGDLQCKSCHEDAYKDWQNSHHDRAMQEASDSTVLGNFENATFESNGVGSRFFKQNGKFFVNTEDPKGLYQDFEVLYTFGVEPLQQYMVSLPGGRLQCLLTAWDTKEKKWFDLMPDERIQPDDWLHWTGGSMTWNTMCADCHSTYLEKNFEETSNTFNTNWEIIDVSCEACHGPGQQHLAYVNSSTFQNEEKISGSYLHLTADLDNKQQVEECGRCHARRGPLSEVFDHSGVMMDHYLPDILRPGLYHADGQILDEVYVYGSFLQSKMYRYNVKCTNCHNAHSMKLLFDGNKLCTQCHVPTQYDTALHHFHEPGTEGADCKSCHMPGKIYMGNDFRRDHSFRIPRPDQSVKYGTPNACTQCHDDKNSEWAAKAVEDWYGPVRSPHFSDILTPAQNGDIKALPGLMAMIGDTSKPEIAQATAVWLLGQSPVQGADLKIVEALKHENAMIRYAAVNAMEGTRQEDRIRYLVPLLDDPVKAVRAQAAYVMADISERLIGEPNLEALQNATADFLNILKVQADFPAGQLQRGQYFHKKQNYIAAEKAYKEALKQDPYLAQAHYNLANLYYQQQQFAKAESEFKEVIRLQPDAADAYYSFGLLQAEMQNLKGAAYSLGKAAELSGNPRYYYNWGLTLQNLLKPKEAEQAFKEGLSIDPNSEINLYALAILYIQQNQRKEAQPIILLLLQINPNNPDYQNLMRAMQ
jgi:predicted CXXCH cytochrome family protein